MKPACNNSYNGHTQQKLVTPCMRNVSGQAQNCEIEELK